MRGRLAEAAFGAGGAVASTVYGTVVVMATLSAAFAVEPHPWRLAVVVMTSVAVLWIAHLYAHGLSESLALERRLTPGDLRGIARRELGMVLAAVGPCAALVLGALGVFTEPHAVAIALAVGLVVLAAEGLRYARVERFGPLATFVTVLVNLALGLLVVLLKVTVEH
jgi:hypothetical protein